LRIVTVKAATLARLTVFPPGIVVIEDHIGALGFIAVTDTTISPPLAATGDTNTDASVADAPTHATIASLVLMLRV